MRVRAGIPWAALVLAVFLSLGAADGCGRQTEAKQSQGRAAAPGGPLTKDDSRNFKGDVTPAVYFRYMGWADDQTYQLGPVDARADLAGKFEGNAWLVMGFGFGAGSGNAKGTLETVDSYSISITNPAGATLDLKLPKVKFVTYQRDDVTPHVRLHFADKKFYGKGDDRSIFYYGKGSGTAYDSALEFSTAAPAELLTRYIVNVEMTLTKKQYKQLRTPGVFAAQAEE